MMEENSKIKKFILGWDQANAKAIILLSYSLSTNRSASAWRKMAQYEWIIFVHLLCLHFPIIFFSFVHLSAQELFEPQLI